MTDATAPLTQPRGKHGSLLAVDSRTKKRNAAEARFKAYGIAALLAGLKPNARNETGIDLPDGDFLDLDWSLANTPTKKVS